jgi:hypothetical protein
LLRSAVNPKGLYTRQVRLGSASTTISHLLSEWRISNSEAASCECGVCENSDLPPSCCL